MTWIKICGTTNLEDAKLAVEAGADALGFVFYEKSPRNINPELAREIVEQLPEHVEKVGVFFGQSEFNAFDIVGRAGLTAIQHYLAGNESTSEGPLRTIASSREKPVRLYVTLPATWILADEARVEGLSHGFQHWDDGMPAETREQIPRDLFTFFLDSGEAGQPGGTGKVFDWRKAVPLVQKMQKKVRVVVAGGLRPDNVGEAIAILQPFGVDVVSGVEVRPGKKDPQKVQAFVQAVRKADQSGQT
jgi:phosphoribosylanthranilate isomerase